MDGLTGVGRAGGGAPGPARHATNDRFCQERTGEWWPGPVCTICASTPAPPVYGMCTNCGAVEVALNKATGSRDLSYMGESPSYPTGYGCEVCL